MRLLARLGGIDRRWLYLMLFVVVAVPVFLDLPIRVKTTPPVQSYYEKVEALVKEEGRIALVVVDFDPQSKAECYPQTMATVRHLMARKVPFAVLTLNAMGAGFCKEIPAKAAKEYGAVYGRDWVNWGFKVGGPIFIKTLASDIQEAVKADARGTPIGEVEMMKGVKDATSVDLVCEVTGFVGALEAWLQFFQKDGRRPEICHGCTAVSGPSNYVFLDSGQISGLLVGMLGAAEYEDLIESPGLATVGMQAQTGAHLLIIILIILGNVSEFVRRRRASACGEVAP
jgi:hypothetical protein